jgi:hypothetical protein
MNQNLRKPVDHIFNQQYDYFALAGLRVSPAIGTTPTSLSVTYIPRPEKARPILHVVTRGSDNKLYHSRKVGNVWTDFTGPLFSNVTATFPSDPALVASGPHQLELAATTANGELFHAHWRDDAWAYTRLVAPTGSSSTYYCNKPAVVASAPGQVEVIVQRADGRLVHHRRVNGGWLSPVALNLPVNIGGNPYLPYYYGSPAAVQAGNKIVLLAKDNYSGVFGMVFDLETATWGAYSYLPTSEMVAQKPALVSSGDLRVDCAYVGASAGNVYHRVLTVTSNYILASSPITGFTAGAETNIGGNVNSTPVLLASGYKQLELIARGTDNKLAHNHYVGPNSPTGVIDGQTVNAGWQGWTTLNNQYFGTATPSRIEEYAAAATRTGKIDIAARVKKVIYIPPLFTQTSYPLYNNAYDGMRYGRTLWKTIGWRGYEQIKSQSYVGQPAMAALDQNTELAFVGAGSTVRESLMGESNAATFTDIWTLPVTSSPNAIAPVVVSSGTGIVDVFNVGMNGTSPNTFSAIRHVRFINGVWNSWDGFNSLSVSGVTFNRPPAVTAYGNGQVDVVAVAQNNNIYHWRFKGGTWSTWTQLGTAISAPSLTYTGAGQLEILTVGIDQKLYRSFLHPNSPWVTNMQLPSSFTINASYFGAQSVSSWGDGSVDAVVVNSQTGAAYHRRVGPRNDTVAIPGFNGAPARSFNSVGGVVADTMVLTAFSPTKLHIMEKGTDGLWYSNWSRLYVPLFPGPIIVGADPQIAWSGFGSIGGSGLLVGGVANTGPKSMVAIAEDANGRVLVNRYNGAIWTGFQPVVGQTTQMQLVQPLYRPAIAVHGG